MDDQSWVGGDALHMRESISVDGHNGSERDICGATRGDGTVCKSWAGSGTAHVGVGRCKFHFGSSPTHNKAAEATMARASLARLGRPAESANPAEELLACVREAKGNVEALRDLVQVLQDPELAAVEAADNEAKANALSVVRGIYGQDHLGDLRDHPLVSMYERWVGYLARFSAEAVKCGLAEREVKVQEDLVGRIAAVMLAFMDDPELGLSYAGRAAGRQILGRHLKGLSAAGPVVEARTR